MPSEELFEKYKNTKTIDIYLSSGNFLGTLDERRELSAFIKILLTFFIPSHNISVPEEEIRKILSTSTLQILWNTCSKLYKEEEELSKNSISEDILKTLELHEGEEAEKQASLTDIRNLLYINYMKALLQDEPETPVLEALRKAFAMDKKESLLNKDHSYDFFMIAFKNFVLNKEQGTPLIVLFERVRKETTDSLKEEERIEETAISTP